MKNFLHLNRWKKNIQQFLYTRDLATRKFLFDLQAQVLLLAQRKFLSVQEYMYFFHSLDRTFFQYILHKYNRILVGEKIHITVFKYPWPGHPKISFRPPGTSITVCTKEISFCPGIHILFKTPRQNVFPYMIHNGAKTILNFPVYEKGRFYEKNLLHINKLKIFIF